MQPDRAAAPQPPKSGTMLRLERPATFTELSVEIGWTKKRTKRWLLRLHARTGGAWLYRQSEAARSPWLINRSLLRKERPELFQHKVADPHDVDRLTARVREVEKRESDTRAKLREFRQKSFDWFAKSGSATPTDGSPVT